MKYRPIENNYYFTGILIVLITLLALFGGPAHSGSTQTNTSGSNTAIAGTPCPIDGKIGKDAKALWSKYDHERPDYKTYVKRMEDRKKADIAEEIAMTKEFEKIEAMKKKEETKNKKNIEWKNSK
jgi:hypothetical protein